MAFLAIRAFAHFFLARYNSDASKTLFQSALPSPYVLPGRKRGLVRYPIPPEVPKVFYFLRCFRVSAGPTSEGRKTLSPSPRLLHVSSHGQRRRTTPYSKVRDTPKSGDISLAREGYVARICLFSLSRQGIGGSGRVVPQRRKYRGGEGEEDEEGDILACGHEILGMKEEEEGEVAAVAVAVVHVLALSYIMREEEDRGGGDSSTNNWLGDPKTTLLHHRPYFFPQW